MSQIRDEWTTEDGSIRLLLGDCLEILPTLESGSVDAVVTDPPYFRVKGEHWDRQWGTDAGYLAWLAKVADHWKRVLKPNGSLYCFASPKMAARVETLIGERFEVLNQIVWVKANGWHARQDRGQLRSWCPQTERIVFAEQRGADGYARGESAWSSKCDELRGFVFEPLRKYLADEFAALGWNSDRLNQICGTASMAGRHYTARSQWCLPTAEHYAKLQAAAGGHLRREYEDLRREYEDLRRRFVVQDDSQYTDVWHFDTVAPRSGKHPCEKPVDLMRHIVRTSVPPGGVVLDPFAGSGSTGKGAVLEGFRFIGIEREAEYFEIAKARIAAKQQPLPLFAQTTFLEPAEVSP